MVCPLKYPSGFFEEDFKKHYRQKGQQKFGVRLRSMIFLQEGKTFEETSRLVCKTVKTLRLWFVRYSAGDIDALLCLSSGRGRKDRLSKKARLRSKDPLEFYDHPQMGLIIDPELVKVSQFTRVKASEDALDNYQQI